MFFQVIFVWRVLRVQAASRLRVTQSRVQAASRRRVTQSPLPRDKPVTSVSQMSRPKVRSPTATVKRAYSGQRNGDIFASLRRRNLWNHQKFFCSCLITDRNGTWYDYWLRPESLVLVLAKNHAVWKPPKKSATSEMRALVVFSQTWPKLSW